MPKHTDLPARAPAVRKRSARALAGLFLAAASHGATGQATGTDASRDHAHLRKLIYDFEVTAYCSLVDDAVAAGFQAALRRELSRLSLSQETLDRIRGKGWQDAHAEWQNRGLGGFKAWCRTEGREAAQRFRNIPATDEN